MRTFRGVLCSLLPVCSAAAIGDESGRVDFQRDLRPILSHHCFQCHGPDDATRQAGLRLDLAEDAIKPADSGRRAIVAHRPEESELVRRIFANDEGERMPPPEANKDLSDQQKQTLRTWIEQGAEYRPHWAFAAPVPSALPNTDSPWLANPVDSFVLARMEKEGLRPTAPCNRYELGRRLWLDLVGFPPSPAEADDFAGEEAPDACDRLVDRLLASPHYGERWARKWLDLARYADTNGYEKDRPRSIWPYRDWVIDALNADMPFDRFTIEQLAGDMFAAATTENLIATGFHRNTMINEEGGVDPLEFRYHAMVDRVNVTGTIWLGLTVGCAQCHSHKFDPFTQTDYYRFMAFLNNADEPEMVVPDAAIQEVRASLQARIDDLESRLPERFPPEGDLDWSIAKPVAASSTNGAAMTILDDGSVLATGERPQTDSYTIVIESRLAEVAAIQIEPLTDSSLPKAGPGRADNGNFVLTSLTVNYQTNDQAAELPTSVYSATADFHQNGFAASGAIDNDPKTGWAIAGKGEWNVERKATFRVTNPTGPGRWTIRLGFDYGGTHTLGRFRIRLGRFLDDGRSLAQRRQAHLDRRFSQWLQEGEANAVRWTPLRPIEATSNLPTLTILDDASVFATGDQSKSDEYHLRLPIAQGPITAMRIEAIADERLPAGGPGRVYYEGPLGDFQLSEFQLTANGQPVSIVSAAQTFAAGANTAQYAIDGNPQTGWSIHGGQGKSHTAIFDFAEPVDADILDLRMIFEKYYSVGLGRFRISVTSDARPDRTTAMPAELEDILAVPSERRSKEDNHRLRTEFLRGAPELSAARAEIEALRRQMPPFPTTLVMSERPPGSPRATHRHHRGEFLQPEEIVPPALPSMFECENAPVDRLGFARWLVDPRNPLSARVTVNRHWAILFGRGIVRTTEDFGYQGESPTHPELLDWLAVEFVHQEWSIKRLHRLLVTSSTYRQSAAAGAEAYRRDPENRWLARGARVRLDAELVRDSMLAAAGLLTHRLGGPSVFPPQPAGVTSEGTYGPLEWKESQGADRYRRGLYTFSKRTAPYAMFATFDAPSGESCVARREVSNTPLQALTSLNDAVVFDAAREMGSQISLDPQDEKSKAELLFRRCLVRPPTPDEVVMLVGFYHAQRERLVRGEVSAEEIAPGEKADAVDRAAWTLVARALLNVDEMIVKE